MTTSEYVGKTCPFCQTPIKPGVNVIVCSACDIPHHRECWEANGGCTTYGCAGMARVGASTARSALDSSATFGNSDFDVGTGTSPSTYTHYRQDIPYDNPYIRDQRDRDGMLIPVEYPQHFTRWGWSWPAFWFPGLWYCIKGMYSQAWKFILVGLIPYVGPWIASIWAGVIGYREYSDFINNKTPEQIRLAKSTGLGCFWALLLIPGIIWFLAMISSI